MAQVNTCLKNTFTILNMAFAIIAGLVIVLTLLIQVLSNDHLGGWTFGLFMFYIMACITMVIAIMGAYGADRENKACLIVFLVCMVIGTLLTLQDGIRTAATRPKLEGVMEADAYNSLPLDQASEEVKALFEEQQKDSCFPIIGDQLLQGINIRIAIDFTLAFLALLSMTLSSIIIHQMRRPDRPTVLLSVPDIFTIPPPKYEELYNPLAY